MIFIVFISFVAAWYFFLTLCVEDDPVIQRRWLIAEIIAAVVFAISAAAWVLG